MMSGVTIQPFLTRSIFLLLTVSLLTLPVLTSAVVDNAEKQAQLTRLKTKIAELKTELESVRGLHDRVRQELEETEQRIHRHVKNLRKIKRQLRQRKKRLRKLKRQRLDLAKALVKHREQLAVQVRTAYSLGKQEYIKLLLNQQQPAEVGRMLRYYDYFNQARASEIAATQKTLKKLANLKNRIQQQQANLHAAQQAQVIEKQQLEDSSRERALVVAKLRNDIKSKDQALQQMLDDQRQLERVLQVITQNLPVTEDEVARQLPFGKLKGKLTWPALGRVDRLFGKRRESGRLRWNGVLIHARQGNNVRAVAAGRIAYADWLRGYGLLVIIDHGDGYMSLYGHNESLLKETGDWVSPADLIASVGQSGGRKRSSLYFEIRYKGKPVNPTRWCKKKPG